ncbi:MAG TPA: serine hydrolase domain-containing protein [Longimicrobiales bacterium]|nr:serine hydrolase domain-containing protein [Longimicrobiales bacterium]
MRATRGGAALALTLLLAGGGPATAGAGPGPRPERGAGARAPAAPPVTRPIDVARIDSLIRKTVAERHMVGLSVGIMQDGKVVLARGYGLADLAKKEPVTPQTLFAIGSVTKQFTCSTVLLLNQEGKLSLKDPVAKYYPKLTRAADITLLDLGQHVSGYRDYYPLDYVDREMRQERTADQVIDEYATRPLDFDPGTRWSYSNTGFLILGGVVEKVTGKPFAQVLSERIFTPLALQHTRYEPARGGPGMATGYTSFALAGPIPATPEARGWVGSAGGIWSTPTDLLTWDLALLDGKVLSPESYRVLTTPRRLADGRSSGYGCGEGVNDRGDAVVLSHGGAVSGFVAQNVVIPATRSAVVLLANTDFGAVGTLQEAIVAELLPHVDVPVIHGPPALDAAKAFLAGLARGTVDRSTLSEDFDTYLTPDMLKAARTAFAAAGPLSDIRVAGTRERGAMEVAVIRFKLGSTEAQALMYRTPDGKIQEFLPSWR